MVCPRRLSFSLFVILMSTTNGEKDSHLGQTVLPPELWQFFQKGGFFFTHPLTRLEGHVLTNLIFTSMTGGKDFYEI